MIIASAGVDFILGPERRQDEGAPCNAASMHTPTFTWQRGVASVNRKARGCRSSGPVDGMSRFHRKMGYRSGHEGDRQSGEGVRGGQKAGERRWARFVLRPGLDGNHSG